MTWNISQIIWWDWGSVTVLLGYCVCVGGGGGGCWGEGVINVVGVLTSYLIPRVTDSVIFK